MALRKSENQPKSNRGNGAEAPGLIFYSLWYNKTHNLSLWCVDTTSRGHVRWTYGSHHTKKKKSHDHSKFYTLAFTRTTSNQYPTSPPGPCDVLFPDRGHHRAPCPLSPLNNMLLTFPRGLSVLQLPPRQFESIISCRALHTTITAFVCPKQLGVLITL